MSPRLAGFGLSLLLAACASAPEAGRGLDSSPGLLDPGSIQQTRPPTASAADAVLEPRVALDDLILPPDLAAKPIADPQSPTAKDGLRGRPTSTPAGPTPPPRTAPPSASQRPARALSPRDALAAANTAARRRPESAGFEGARQIYLYEPGALYELHANPAFISTIELGAGEILIDIAAGDTVSWTVSNTQQGSGAETRTLVMVKPKSAGLKTNLVLVTDRNTYLIEAISATGEAYAAQIAWRYPAPPARLVQPKPDPLPRPLHDAYRILSPRSQRPAWTPIRVVDDGRKTWIEFPAAIAASDMPPLFVRTPEGAELVNYRVDGAVYVVDRLFERAELRFGSIDPIVVRIERIDRQSKRSPPAIKGQRP